MERRESPNLSQPMRPWLDRHCLPTFSGCSDLGYEISHFRYNSRSRYMFIMCRLSSFHCETHGLAHGSGFVIVPLTDPTLFLPHPSLIVPELQHLGPSAHILAILHSPGCRVLPELVPGAYRPLPQPPDGQSPLILGLTLVLLLHLTTQPRVQSGDCWGTIR